jgi:two-component system, OmpR family, response regulator
MRILLVEDEDELAKVIRRQLKRSDFAVDCANSLSMARETLKLCHYPLTILDRRLPDGDGISLIPEIREHLPNARVLILSACDKAVDIVSGLNCGADDYLRKPFHFDELLARIRTQLSRTDILHPSIRVGALTFDPRLRDITVNGKAVQLRGRELMLLEVLIKNAGRIVRREALIDELYDMSDDVEPKAVNLVAQRLRSKLIDLNAGVEIHSARGVGYMLIGDPQ